MLRVYNLFYTAYRANVRRSDRGSEPNWTNNFWRREVKSRRKPDFALPPTSQTSCSQSKNDHFRLRGRVNVERPQVATSRPQWPRKVWSLDVHRILPRRSCELQGFVGGERPSHSQLREVALLKDGLCYPQWTRRQSHPRSGQVRYFISFNTRHSHGCFGVTFFQLKKVEKI